MGKLKESSEILAKELDRLDCNCVGDTIYGYGGKIEYLPYQTEKFNKERLILIEAFAKQVERETIEKCSKISEKERKRWSRPGGASCSSQQMQEYAKQACAKIRDAILALIKED